MKSETKFHLQTITGFIIAFAYFAVMIYAQQAPDINAIRSNTDFASVNQGDPINGAPGYIWWHNGSGWTAIDCNHTKLNPYTYGGESDIAVACSNLGFNRQQAPPLETVWETGAIYFSGYPNSKWMLISVSISPLTNKKILTMQYLLDPEIFYVFSEDKQTRPFQRVR